MKTVEPATSASFSTAQTGRSVRSYCQGMLPLSAKLEPWIAELCQSTILPELAQKQGSPLNVLNTQPFERNAKALYDVAEAQGLEFDVYFARKANKCLAFVETAKNQGYGVDTASIQELQQVLDNQVPPEKIICTAAVKSEALLRLCIKSGVTIAVDHLDELMQIVILAEQLKQRADIAVRLSGFQHQGARLPSRFGFDLDEVLPLIEDLQNASPHCLQYLNLIGVHFHLDGYCQAQRVSAIQQLLPLIDELRSRDFPVRFLDIGGGFPMSYLESETEWDTFWQTHRRALLGEHRPLTYRNHGLGLTAIDGTLIGKPNCYPYYQSPVQANWLEGILTSECEAGTIADSLRKRQIQLRCEPGRSLLDGCGFTAARVEFRKQQPTGDWLIGLSMNRTQCRTSSDDFLVDPLLIPATEESLLPRTPAGISGYLVGAYCTESELLCLRKLQFPHGVGIGDLIVFPNTAGYFMHFLESRSHQFPLARNVVYDNDTNQAELDSVETYL
ncbi:Diaminopimelate decarboxylase [Gimesia maris]|uniref:Y4yA family PLP-dependent enzyme n=1 Tax=Gimesia maris TaxID=122 RepID=UPI00118C307C|nr:Y4yA family PLP-dependent enzyme [Gimesia maris]QDT76947.1 Diaminopimelate decarboxylase [Gimesia maris]